MRVGAGAVGSSIFGHWDAQNRRLIVAWVVGTTTAKELLLILKDLGWRFEQDLHGNN